MEIFRGSMSRLFMLTDGKGELIFHSIIMIVQALCYLSVLQIFSVTSESDVKLLYTRHPHQIVLKSVERNSTDVIVNVTGTPQSLAFDLKNEKIYWAVRSGESYEATGIQRANMINGLQMETVLFKSEGLNVFTGMALDWITLNIYYADGRQMHIGVCDNDGVNCAVLVHDAENQPFRIAVCPNEGYMFWTVRGGWPRAIFRAEMDGSHVTAIVKDGVNLPGGIAVDSSRIYWSDPDVGKIGTSDMDGNDVRFWEPQEPCFGSIMHVTVSTDKIFWVNTNDQTIKACDKKNCSKVSIVEKLTKLHILHDMIPISQDAQPRYRENPCANQPCPHICALTAKSFRCFCPIGLTLGDDGVTCTDQGSQMVIATPNEIQVISLGTKKATHISPLHHPSAITYDFAKKQIYWADFFNSSNAIYRANITGEIVQQVFRIPGSKKVTGIAYDWITGNIYYTNGDHVGVCDDLGEACAVILRERPDPPYRIALFPKIGMMYWTTRGMVPSIKRARMDGASPFRIIRGTAMRGPLVIDQREHRMFWLDRSDSIETSDLEWRDRRTIRPLRNQLAGVGIEGGRLYWIDGQMAQSCDKKTLMDLKTVTVHQDNLSVFDMVLFHAEGQPNDRHNHCKGHICSHVCVLTEHYFRCLCPEGMTLGPDGSTCQDCSASNCNATDSEPLCKPKIIERTRPSNKTCSNAFACKSGSCLDEAKVCDGVCDCDDGTDEGLGCGESCDNLDCSQSCRILPEGPQCTCHSGFHLAKDLKTCEDVNECEIPGICSSACINVNGSYSCGNYSAEDAFVRKSLVAVAVILTVFAVGVVAVAAVVGYKYKQAREIIRSLTPEEIEEFLEGNESAAKRAADGPEKAFLLPFKHVLPADSINIAYEAILGSGNFAVVYRGFYGPEAVAVKKFKRTVEINEFKSVLAEAKIMAYIGEHEHIVRFIGADVSRIAEQKIVIVTELSPYGDLLSFLRSIQPMVLNQHASAATEVTLAPSLKTYVPIGVTPKTLLSWCGQIASALGFLELKKIVHGDLAARNVLIFKDFVVKIADFGLSKQLYDTSEYISKGAKFLPWRWAAPEVLSRLEFSSESDIWSFGVTAWEILSLGREPYEDVFAYGSAFRAHLQDGHRLECPEWADQLVYQMLLNCWNVDRCNRPRFSALTQFFNYLDVAESDSSSLNEEPAPPYSQVFPSDTISG